MAQGQVDGKQIVAAVKQGLAALAMAMEKSPRATDDDRALMASVISGFDEVVARSQRNAQAPAQGSEPGPMQRRMQQIG